jgi:hypothetical protein
MSRAGTDAARRSQAQRLAQDLVTVVRTARKRGVLYAAGMLEAFDDDVVSAMMLVSVVTVPAGDADILTQLGRLRPSTQPDAQGAWQKVVPVDLPATGPAGRVLGVEVLPIDDRVKVPYVTMHTAIPIPGGGSAMIVTGGSPNVGLADELYDLFDAITSPSAS